MLKAVIKKLINSIAPKTATAILSARARAFSQKWLVESGRGLLTTKLIEHLGTTVRSGPFVGMVLSEMTRAENLGPYLLGTYESELHAWINAASKNKYCQILDIGSKFGYYAVGLARMHPHARCIAFETDWWARKATREMLRVNCVSTCAIQGFCDPRWIDSNLAENAFIISDCEGYEGELFRRAKSPKLDRATMLIETHDCVVSGVSAAIKSRFSATHEIEAVLSAEKAPPSGVDLGFLTPDEIAAATNELRPKQTWLFLTPKDLA